MSINLQLPKLTDLEPRLTVIGIGGAGCNAVNNMIAAGLNGVEFVVANTDAQALSASSAEHRIQLGVNLTEGLGAGARPEIGQAAAEEAIDEIRAQVSGSHMVFLAAGMGGGTGTGAASVIARVAREMGILVVGVVTKPFQFEGSRRMRLAEAGIEDLKQCVDTLIVIPNQNLFRIANEKTTFAEAFVLADHVLYSGVACIVDLIIKEGLINLDFADVRTVMAGMGTAMMGTGEASGERRATVAAEEAISNPLLDDISLSGAKGLLLSITGGEDLTLFEVDEAASRVRTEVDGEATIIVGATYDHSLDEKIRVSIVASGMDRLELASSSEDARATGTYAASGNMLGAAGGGDANANNETMGDSVTSDYGSRDNNGYEGSGAVGNVHIDDDGFGSEEPQNAPPPIPHRESSGDLQRRLSEAIESGRVEPYDDPSVSGVWENSAAVDESQTSESMNPPSAGQHDYRQAQQPGRWSPAGDVVIEEGIPPLSRAPGPAKDAGAQGNGQGQHPVSSEAVEFRPAAPPIRQQFARRMPTVDDFPVVGQREYHARASQSAPADGRAASGAERKDRQAGSQGKAQGTQSAPGRARSLFERLTGIRRRQSDSQSSREKPAQDAQHSRGQMPGRSHDNATGHAHQAGQSGDERRANIPPEDAEFPALFTRRRAR